MTAVFALLFDLLHIRHMQNVSDYLLRLAAMIDELEQSVLSLESARDESTPKDALAHQQLRAEVVSAIAELDQLIDRATR